MASEFAAQHTRAIGLVIVAVHALIMSHGSAAVEGAPERISDKGGVTRFGSGRASGLHLELQPEGFYFRAMKRMAFVLAMVALGATPLLSAQDAATEERLNKLAGQIEDLRAGQDALHKQVEALVKELDSMREQIGKPTGNYAAQEDLKRVAEAVKEVDQKRLEDAEKIQSQLLNLRKELLAAPTPQKKPVRAEVPNSDQPQKGFEYTIQKGDSLSIIVAAYRDKNIKVTVDQILKANPDLNPNKLRVGQKIFIPAPKS